MAIAEREGGYTVDDLDWLRDEFRFHAHLELDPWGALVVTPASDEHESAVSELLGRLFAQLHMPRPCVRSNTPWMVPGGSGYHNVPDLIVLAEGWRRVEDEHFDPPPLLVIEVGSPSTRRVDRGRKLSDYRLGGAGLYVLVDLPSTFEVHDFSADRTWVATGSVDLRVGTDMVHLQLP